MKMAAASGNKQAVYACNQNLIKLRDWPLQNEFLISCLVAIAVERIRLEALAILMQEGKISRQEIIELTGSPVDWERYLHCSYGAEATAFKSVLAHLQRSFTGSQKEYKVLNAVKKYMPLYLQVHFQRDYCFALQSCIKVSSVPQNLSGVEKVKHGRVDQNEIKRKFYIISGMVLTALERMYIRTSQIADCRQMALLAAEIMEFRKQHGKLPEDLSFLPQVPLAKLDHQPLMYEKTKDGFRIYSNTPEGKKPAAKDISYSYWVRL